MYLGTELNVETISCQITGAPLLHIRDLLLKLGHERRSFISFNTTAVIFPQPDDSMSVFYKLYVLNTLLLKAFFFLNLHCGMT